MPSERLLSEVLREFARTMVTDFPIQGILDHLVERIVEVLPITGAGVTLIAPGAVPRYVAASDPAALRFEELQSEVGAGPRLLAYETGEAVAVTDLRAEPRFGDFTTLALEAGLSAVFTFPLRHGDKQLGALDLYRDRPGPLGAAAVDAAQTLADVASAYIINAQGRAELLETSDRAHAMARHDPLTGLPNRALFLERLDHAVLRSRRSLQSAAVLFADLDGFKLVNDVYGHNVGDELLAAVAERLAAVLRPSDTLARLGGDEFVILCEDLTSPAQADSIAGRVCAALKPPFTLAVGEIEITASIGIAVFDDDHQHPSDLLQDADMAMYQAKRQGRGRHQIIDLSEKRRTLRQAGLERDLRGATGRGELRLDYQPIVETGGGRVTGVEALVRWAHPAHGLLAPAALVPAAEQTGLINEIGGWVLEQACLERRPRNGRHGGDNLTISVNVSPLQLISAGYAGRVADTLSATGTDPRLVVLEVTESAFVQDSARAVGVLNELRHIGLRVALDDFGAGYSSLQYLKQFPIDIVKIDRKFICDLEHDAASHAIVFAIVELGHILGMTVVAEGVETAEQHDLLASIGCDLCQGFYFAPPMSGAGLESLIRRQGTDVGLQMPTLPRQRAGSS